MNDSIKLLDVVAVITDIPEKGLLRGHVGTIVEAYDADMFEVEFVDPDGHTYALETLHKDQLMTLHHYAVNRERIA